MFGGLCFALLMAKHVACRWSWHGHGLGSAAKQAEQSQPLGTFQVYIAFNE